MSVLKSEGATLEISRENAILCTAMKVRISKIFLCAQKFALSCEIDWNKAKRLRKCNNFFLDAK